MGLAGLGKPRIPGSAGAEKSVEFQIEVEVLLQGGGSEKRVVPDQLPMTDREGDGLAANPAGEFPRRGLVPAKGLAPEEGGRKVQRNGELQGRHCGEKLKVG